MKRLIVYHGYYGCETGCCGHYVDYVDDEDIEDDGQIFWTGTPTSQFDFDHPYSQEDAKDFIRKMVTKQYGEDHVADIDWDRCVVYDMGSDRCY